MDELERQRLVADAILLERASRVLDRRKHGPGHLTDRLNDGSLAFKMRVRAYGLRQAAGQSDEEIRETRAGSDSGVSDD